jgi:hypothetical protein
VPSPSQALRVLIVHKGTSPSVLADVQSRLQASLVFQSPIASFDAGAATGANPTGAFLAQHDVVLVLGDGAFFDSATLGTELKAYADACHGVVLSLFAYRDEAFGTEGLDGDFDLSDYHAIIETQANDVSGPAALGIGTFVGTHSILTNSFNPGAFTGGTGSRRPATLLVSGLPGTTRVADWADGTPLVATREIVVGTKIVRRVDLGLFPVTTAADSSGIDPATDFPLVVNALLWAGGRLP